MPHKDPKKKKEYFKKYYQENRAKWKEAYEASKEQILEQKRINRLENPEKFKLIDLKRYWKDSKKQVARVKAYAQANPEKANFRAGKRRAAKLQRTPKWLTASDWIEIKWAYRIASERSKETGIKHAVDHIIPLQGENISGLHVPWNLQILTVSANCSKHNKIKAA